MTIEQLYEIITTQEHEINRLKCELQYLKGRFDSNDYWVREMIDALTESVDGIMDDHCCCERYQISHEERRSRKYAQQIENREDV